MFLLGHQFDQDIFLPHLNTRMFKQYYSDTDSPIIINGKRSQKLFKNIALIKSAIF
ncbi:protein of unknown function [Xenorhabdus nematophila AN6/1]|nr:protein of unknown function [Xenorhabdus nematophila AN6/1]